MNENGNGNGNEIDVKAIFLDVDGTLSDAHCTEENVEYNLVQYNELLSLLRKLKDKGVKLFILTRCFTYENICNGVRTKEAEEATPVQKKSAIDYYAPIVEAMDGVFSADKVISINKPIPEMSSEDGWAVIKSLYMDTVFNMMILSKRTSVYLIDDSKINAEFAANEFGFSAFHNADNTDNYVGKALDMTNNALRMLLGEEIEDSSRNFFTQVRQVQPIEDYKIRELKQQHPTIKEHIEQIVTQLLVLATRKKFSCPPPPTVLDIYENVINLNEHEFAELDFEVSRTRESLSILGNRLSNYEPPKQNKIISKHDNFFVLYINSFGQICIKGIREYKYQLMYNYGNLESTLNPDTETRGLYFYDISDLPDLPKLTRETPDEIRSQVINQVIKHINENKQQFLKELYSALQQRLEQDYRYKKEFNHKFHDKSREDFYTLPSLDKVLFIRPHELPKETDRQKQRREAWSKFLEERERRKSEKENNRNT